MADYVQQANALMDDLVQYANSMRPQPAEDLTIDELIEPVQDWLDANPLYDSVRIKRNVFELNAPAPTLRPKQVVAYQANRKDPWTGLLGVWEFEYAAKLVVEWLAEHGDKWDTPVPIGLVPVQY